jgi:formylglycine-generating enzyme required for sulfatase activity
MRVSVRGGRVNGGTRALFGALAAAFLCAPVLTGCGGDGNIDDTAVIVGNEVIEMVFVHGGTFMMGCTAEQLDNCYDDEYPAHQVTLSNFYIGKYEVTQAQWTAVMGDNPSYHTGDKLRQYFTGDESSPYYFTGDSLPPYFAGGSLPVYLTGDKLPAYFTADNLPVENVAWNDVLEFVSRLNTMTGKEYRLPTEAEWEYAARGGNRSRGYKYSGSDDVDDVAWYGANTKRPRPAGAKQPNELGIYDMSGNVWEWVDDWYDENYYGSSPADNPKGPKPARTRVQRGGTWSASDFHCRVSDRFSYWPDKRDSDTGFRLAQDP